METIDKSVKRAKAASLEALMKSKKMSKIIEDGWGEPSGSSKRDRMRSVVGSVHRAHKNYYAPFYVPPSMDGQGGPGLPQPGQQPGPTVAAGQPGAPQAPMQQAPGQDMMQPEEVMPKRNVVLPGVEVKEQGLMPSPGYVAQELRGQQSKSGTASSDFMKDMNNWLNAGKSVYGYFSKGMEGLAEGLAGAALDTGQRAGRDIGAAMSGMVTGYREPDLNNWRAFHRLEGERVAKFGADVEMFREYGGNLYREWSRMMNTFGPALYRGPKALSKPDVTAESEVTGEKESVFDKYGNLMPGADRAPKETEPTEPLMDPVLNKGYDRLAAEQYYGNLLKDAAERGLSPSEIADEGEGKTNHLPLDEPFRTDDEINVQYGMADIEAMKDIYGLDAVDQWWDSITDPDIKARYEPVYNAVKNGESTSSIVWRIMKDPDLLSKTLGVPKEALKYFPKDGSLASHLIDLRNLTEDKYRLDEMLYGIEQKALSGANLEDNVSAYIRGKDEYLTEIDRLIFDTNEQVAEMDTSNPYVAQRMSNYQNYLTILKGRQNQRYIDFLDMSLNQHNSELERLQSVYDRASTEAEKQFTDIKALTVERYAEVQALLTDMADTVSQKEDKWREKMRFEQEMLSAAMQNASAGIDLKYKPLVYEAEIKAKNEAAAGADADEFTWDLGELKDIDAKLGYADEDGAKSVSNYSDPLTMYNAISTSGDMDVESGFDHYLERVGTTLEQAVSRGDFGEIDVVASSLKTAINKEMVGEADSEVLQAVTDRFMGAVGKSIENGLYSRINQEPTQTDVMEAVKDLVGKGWIRKPRQLNERGSFVSEHAGIGTDLAGALFDVHAASIQPNPDTGEQGANPESTFDIDGNKPWKVDSSLFLNDLVNRLSSVFFKSALTLN